MNFCRPSISPPAAAPAKEAARLPGSKIRNGIAACLALAVLTLGQSAQAAQIVWNNTGTDFNSTGSWTGGVVPSGNNNAAFSTGEVTQPNLSTSLSLAGIVFTTSTAFGYDITSSGGAAFTLTGNTAGSAAQSTNSGSAAIFAANTSGTNTFDVNLTLAPATGTTSTFNQAAGGTLVVNGIVSGTGITLNLPGAGTIQLAGPNTYSGGTSLNTGTLQIGNDSALGTGTLTLGTSTATVIQATGGARTIANNVVWGGSATISGSNNLIINGTFTNSTSAHNLTSSITGGNTLTLAGNVFLSASQGTALKLTILGTGNTTISGVIADSAAGTTTGTIGNNGLILNQTAGTLTLSNANTYTGSTTLSQGTLILGNKAAFGTSTVTWNGVSASANTDLSGANAIANTTNFNAGGNIFTGSNNIEFSGTVTNGLTGTNTITNNMSPPAVLTLSGTVNLSNNATAKTLIFGGTGNTTITGVVANGGGSTSSLGKSGAGTLTLTNSNTYTGTTTINASGGTLEVANNGTTLGRIGSTATITVNSGGTLLLSGSGSADRINDGAGITLAGGILAKGSGVNEGSTSAAGMGALTLTANSTIDFTQTAGTLTFTSFSPSTFTLSITDYIGTGSAGGTDQLIFNQDQATRLGSFDFGFGAGVNVAEFDLGGGFWEVYPTVPVPEPSTWIGAALALAAIGFTQRKRLAKRFRVIG